ncbi:ABC transporter related [Methylocella silvestris BL2]|uniref:ABC transporter related n=1 Tax=Methylocella silvestris (strain DSM 15510 / CIP 108128 / LMG 27833 / NCIMB 13906 / BL2) TaxID=395965 RepID=B8EQ36_METSB|nr:ABC transporter ATP-binding protein [Methylocella silvestris]ACK51526.1 ABC transporter related [Methylocella silvestris BL2]
MTTISLQNVWKEYEGKVVLEKLSLEIAPQSFVALVGPSGCGKTTFLRMLLSEETPTRGRILIDGAPLAPEPTVDRGVVFQRYSVFPHLTVTENVLLGKEFAQSKFLGMLYGKARRKALEEADALLAEVGLTGAASKYPAQLSGGMQQRLALAQALITRPKILLLDEPFGALDPGIKADIHVLMLRLWKETKMTVVMVTHDLSEAFRLGTRVLVFERKENSALEPDRFGATITRDIDVWPPKHAAWATPAGKKTPTH